MSDLPDFYLSDYYKSTSLFQTPTHLKQQIFFSEIQRNKLEFERDVAKIAKTKGSGDKACFEMNSITLEVKC